MLRIDWPAICGARACRGGCNQVSAWEAIGQPVPPGRDVQLAFPTGHRPLQGGTASAHTKKAGERGGLSGFTVLHFTQGYKRDLEPLSQMLLADRIQCSVICIKLCKLFAPIILTKDFLK